MMIYEMTKEFEKDLKQLTKKYRSLPEDLENLKQYSIELFHGLNIVVPQAIVKVEGLCSDNLVIYKVRKISCRSLKTKGANSGLRLIYAYHVETKTITFIEMYAKNQKSVEDKERIKTYIAKNKEQ